MKFKKKIIIFIIIITVILTAMVVINYFKLQPQYYTLSSEGI